MGQKFMDKWVDSQLSNKIISDTSEKDEEKET